MSQTKDLPPITIPRSRQASLLSSRYLPSAVFVCGVIAAALLWRNTVSTPLLQAEVENPLCELRAPLAGQLVKLETAPLAQVRAGERLAVLLPLPPALLTAELAVLRAEMDCVRANFAPAQGLERAGLAYERLRLDWMKQRVELAELRSKLVAAEDSLQRLERLRKDSVSSEQEYSTARNLRDGLLAQVSTSEELVASQERSLESHRLEYSPGDVVARNIELLSRKLRVLELQAGPQELLAPTSGQVSVLARSAGEQVQAGELILSLVPSTGKRLVAYLRQPLRELPRPGMAVTVRARRGAMESFRSRIEEVGASLQPIPRTLTNPLLPASTVETGLQLGIHCPEGLALLPGEIVDVSLARDDS